MTCLPALWICLCGSTLRHSRTASSSRQYERETIFPGQLRLSKRSIDMNPSTRASNGRNAAAASRYASFWPGRGCTSKITAIMVLLAVAGDQTQGALDCFQETALLAQD